MSYFGSYFGTTPMVTVAPPAPPAPSPIVTSTTYTAPAFQDHITLAINRLCAYSRAKAV